jgi:Tat protein translocase TatB subunit
MGNLGAPEVLVIFIVALIVLGPNKLPDAARQVGKAMTEIRRVSSGFQRELKDAMEDPLAEERAREAGRKEVAESQKKTHPLAGRPPRGGTPAPESGAEPEPDAKPESDAEPTDT